MAASLPSEEIKPVFGEALAYLHRHNRLALAGALVAMVFAVLRAIGA